jgi:transposase
VDETSVSLHPVLRRCWMKRGQRKTIPAPGSPRYIHTFGAYHWRDDTVWHQTKERKNSDTFIEFIEYLMLQAYPDVQVVIVMDNASYHRSRASRAALSLFAQRLYVVWLPRYCPFLNAIERFWLHLKSLAAANCLHRDLTDLIQAIDDTIHNQNQPDHPDRLNFAKHFPLSA